MTHGVAPLSLTGRILQTVVRFSCARPSLTIFTAVAMAALGVGYTAYALRLETSKFHLLPLHQPYATLYKDYAEDFGQLQDIVVVVQSVAVIRIFDHQHGWQRKMILVVRIKKQGGLGQRQEQLGFLCLRYSKSSRRPHRRCLTVIRSSLA